jgi:phosphoribosylanthranilate isomerase
VFVKICGMTSEEDALYATAMGADAVGFVFAPSARQIAPDLARDIAKRLPPEVLTVGVFRDQAPQRVVEICNTAGLRCAQLHGHETAEQASYVKERVPLLIQAFAAGDPALERADDYPADAFLIDNHTPGSGEVFDWSLGEGAPQGRRIIVAGGLTADNVAEAVRVLRPWGVDVSTGVERAPGRKDPVKVRRFIEAARSAEAPEYQGDENLPYDWQEELFR